MNSRRISGALLLSAGLFAGAFSAPSLADRQLPRDSTSWISNGQTRTVTLRPDQKAVRICVNDAKNVVALKVVGDGKSTIVERGECVFLEARTISLTAATKLRANMAMDVVRTSSDGTDAKPKYRTDLTLAQVQDASSPVQ